ncbi:MAG: transporter substrate-binding domain-containing protein [Deferribacterales bacterium]
MSNRYLFIIILLLGIPLSSFGMDALAVYPEHFPPYFFKTGNGETAGLGIDVLKKATENTDIRITFKPVPDWTTAIRMVKTGDADLIPNIGISDDRLGFVKYTVPIDTSTLSLFVRKSSRVRNLDDLKGEVLATTPYSVGMSLVKDRKDMTIITSDDPAGLLYMLMSGQCDAVLFSYDVLRSMMKTMKMDKDIKVIEPPLADIKRSVAVSVNNPALYEKLNNALSDFVGTDEYQKIYDRWHLTMRNGHTSDSLFKILLGIAVAVAAALAVWRYFSLKQANNLLQITNDKLESTRSALNEAEIKFTAMADTINDIIWFTNPELTKLLYVNSAYEKIYGKSVESLYRDPRSYMECIPEEDKAGLVLSKGGQVEPKNNIKHRVINAETGETRWVLSQYYPYYDESGKLLFYTGFISDITSVVTAENEKSMQQQITSQQSRFAALGEMVGSISHQWRQPLNTLYLCLQLMEDSCDTDPPEKEAIRKYIKDSMELVEHMSGTIEDFRDFFKTNKKTESFDAPRTVLHILRMITPQLKAHKITYNLECTCAMRSFSCVNNFDPGNPPCKNLINGIPNEFKHAVLNILQNAKEALTHKDSESKNIYINMSSADGLFVISIADNAGGIDEKLLPKIFEPYVSGKDDGTGMGLYLAKSIIDKMMGTIKAENVNGGARFIITLPVIHVQEEKPEPGQETRPL